MNQILVTKKLYITPELKRKKKAYKIEFFLSVFLVCALIFAYVYAEYSRNKDEQVSQEILANLDIPEDTTVAENNVLVVLLDEVSEEEIEAESNSNSEPEVRQQEPQQVQNQDVQTTANGFQYATIATIQIPKINVTYPIIDGLTDSAAETEELLKISPTKFWGPDPNEVGNFCVVGHNYRNTRFFSKVPTLNTGDVVQITDLSGKMIQYKIYNKYQVDPTDVSCTTQLTNGKKEITLITCTDDSKHRVVVKAREM